MSDEPPCTRYKYLPRPVCLSRYFIHCLFCKEEPRSSIIGPRLEISKDVHEQCGKFSNWKNNFSSVEAAREGVDEGWNKGKRKDVVTKRRWEVPLVMDSKIRVLPPNQLLITSICIFIEKFLSPHARAR